MLPDVTEHTRATSFAHSIVRALAKSLPRVCAGLKRVPYRAAVIAHIQESFYLVCSVTRVTKVSELFFPDKTNAIKNL